VAIRPGLISALLCLTLHASAQTPQNDWSRVQQLPTNAKIHITADTRKLTCRLTTVTPGQITCANDKGQATFPRTEIKSIKLANRGRSTAVGAAIGIGIGAGVGAGIGAATNSGDTGSLLHVGGGKASAVGAGLGAIILGITGAIVGSTHDTLAGSTIYKR
jgi:hypothetical protein